MMEAGGGQPFRPHNMPPAIAGRLMGDLEWLKN